MNALYKKYKNTKNKYIYEIILQWYLIKQKMRNIALIQVSETKFLPPLVKFMNENDISYKILDNTKMSSIKKNFIIYNKKTFDIDNFDESNQKKFGELLGKFYVCASNDFRNNNHRVVILFNNIEIFAQMCKKANIIDNFEKFYNIYLKLHKLFYKLDPTIFGKIEFYEIHN